MNTINDEFNYKSGTMGKTKTKILMMQPNTIMNMADLVLMSLPGNIVLLSVDPFFPLPVTG